MRHRDAVALIAEAVGHGGGQWADFGAGTGTFTRALAALLAPGSRIYAVDHEISAVETLRRIQSDDVEIIAVHADFTTNLELPGLGPNSLDGLLIANALHFVPKQDDVLTRLVARLRPGGQVVLVEYDQRSASR